MRYTVSKSIVWAIGRIWMPNTTAAQVYELSAYDVGNMRDDTGNITRESVQNWLDMNAGDFASVDDFRASIEDDGQTVEIEWASEESELTYSDCMSPQED